MVQSADPRKFIKPSNQAIYQQTNKPIDQLRVSSSYITQPTDNQPSQLVSCHDGKICTQRTNSSHQATTQPTNHATDWPSLQMDQWLSFPLMTHKKGSHAPPKDLLYGVCPAQVQSFDKLNLVESDQIAPSTLRSGIPSRFNPFWSAANFLLRMVVVMCQFCANCVAFFGSLFHLAHW